MFRCCSLLLLLLWLRLLCGWYLGSFRMCICKNYVKICDFNFMFSLSQLLLFRLNWKRFFFLIFFQLPLMCHHNAIYIFIVYYHFGRLPQNVFFDFVKSSKMWAVDTNCWCPLLSNVSKEFLIHAPFDTNSTTTTTNAIKYIQPHLFCG